MTNRKRTIRNAPHDSLRLFDGWVLPLLFDLEEQANRRLIGLLSTATSDRRSAVFSALAALVGGPAPPPVFVDMTPDGLTEWLLTTPPRRIVDAVYGEASGLAATVFKTGGAPLDAPDHYFRLAAMVSDSSPRGKKQVRCLTQAQRITSDLVLTLDVLREAYLHPGLVVEIGNAGMAQKIDLVSDFLMKNCPNLTEPMLLQSLTSPRDESLHDWASRMLLRHAVVDCDLKDDADFTYLRSAEDFRRIAETYRNCIATPDVGKLTSAVLGISAYAVYQHEPVVVELLRMHDGRDRFWACEGVHAPGNGFVPEAIEETVRRKLRDRGVMSLTLCTGSDDLADVAEQIHVDDPFGRFALRRRHRRLRR